jgi:hypothetical protein
VRANWQGPCITSITPQPKESQVKRFDYYADQNPWKMPKWVGALLGGIFTVVAVGAVVLIVHLTRPAHASALMAEPTAEPAAEAEGVVTPPPPATSTAPAQVAVPPARHLKAHTRAKTSKHASRSAAKAPDKAAAILAKHDNHAKRKAKDDLDRMLGL